jgi:hypothetical protein
MKLMKEALEKNSWTEPFIQQMQRDYDTTF